MGIVRVYKGEELIYQTTNLVLQGGRMKLAEYLGGKTNQSYVDRLVLGEGDKTAPMLMDDGSDIDVIEADDGSKTGVFQLTEDDIFYPDSAPKIPDTEAGWAESTGRLFPDGTFIDKSQNFSEVVSVDDHITFNVTSQTRLPILEVDETALKLYNPGQLELQEVEYRIDTSGTQVVFSKLIEGNFFDPDKFGPNVRVTTAGLMMNDNTLFNRVIFGAPDDNSGIILRSDESPGGIESSYRFEFTFTF